MSVNERFADLEDVGLGSEAVWRTTEIRQTKPSWAAFRDSRLISDTDAQLLIRFQREPVHTQGAFVSEDSAAFTHAFIGVLKSVSDVTAVLFILTTVDELMKENRDIAKLFKPLIATNFDPFDIVTATIKHHQDDLIVARSCSVLCQLFNAGLVASDSTVVQLMDFVHSESQYPDRHKKFCFLAILNILQGVLRDNAHRVAFMEAHGMQMLLPLLKQKSSNSQLQYQVCHYIWLLSYCPKVQNKLADMEVVALLVHVMKSTQKEKVIRMILAILVNLIDLPEMQNILAVCGAQRLLQSMYNRSWSDEDIKDDIDELLDKVGKNVEASSTFDEYCKEVMSGELEWTPMHRSATFWEKNVHKFLEKDQQVLKVLVELLKPGARIDSKALAVALHDVGEFVRAHPAGKKHVTALNAKPYIMQHLTSSNTEINKEALTCVQKLMVH